MSRGVTMTLPCPRRAAGIGRGPPPASSKKVERERGGVHHGGDADGENGNAERLAREGRGGGCRRPSRGRCLASVSWTVVQTRPRLCDASASNGNDKVRAHGLHRAAHELGGLQSRCAEDAGRQHADIRERTEGGAALQVARGGHMIRRRRDR